MNSRISWGHELPSSSVLLPVPSIPVLLSSPSLLSEMCDKINTYGIVVLAYSDIHIDHLPLLRTLFGTPVPHQKQDDQFRVMIDPVIPTSINVANTDLSHLPHTDEAYMPYPGKLVTLLCESMSESGGDSVFINGKKVVEMVRDTYPDRYKHLFHPSCLTVGRKLPGVTEPQICTLPILTKNKQDKNLSLRFRSNDTYVKEVIPEAKEVWLKMCEFTSNRENQLHIKLQPKQMVIIDNSGVVHGRTPFNCYDKRRLWRMNFYNDGSLKERLHLGAGVGLDVSESELKGIGAIFC